MNRALEDTNQLGINLSIYSLSAMAVGRYDLAGDMLAESLAILRQVGNRYRIAMALNISGDLARLQQHYARARSLYEESIAIMRQLEAVRDLASGLQNLGHTCLRLGDFYRAESLFHECIHMQQAQGNRPGVAEGLIGYAAMAAAANLPAAGARLLAAAVAIGSRRVTDAWAATHQEYVEVLDLIRSRLAPDDFRTEQMIGASLTIEQAVQYAFQLPLLQPPVNQPEHLTRRETEVARLIAAGKTNGEIAQELVLSKRTVEKHIANIRAKLDFNQRSQIVRWAFDTGLAKPHV